MMKKLSGGGVEGGRKK
jgi:hypothetical protein